MERLPIDWLQLLRYDREPSQLRIDIGYCPNRRIVSGLFLRAA
jgi:hypothetical protein